ncbi:MAG: leucyl-tRNA synthetase [Rhodothermales bacterium]|jgi:leucyl-tRNA synthetase
MTPRDDWHLNFDSAPFCNGSLHLGHVRCYALGDVRARWLRSQGADIRYSTAFDAFGLPHQAGAAAAGLPTHEYVDSQIERIARQMRDLRLSYNLDDHPRTCDPGYYRWTQWLFLELWRSGLVYRAERALPYCEQCCEYLAASQVENGGCWRCGEPVSARASEEWFIRTSDYTEVLSDTVEDLSGWSDRARNLMRAFLGRMEGERSTISLCAHGAEYQFELFASAKSKLDAITLRSDHPLALFLNTDADAAWSRRSQRTGQPLTRHALCLLELAGGTVPLFVTPSANLPHGTDAVPSSPGEIEVSHLEAFSAHQSRSEESIRYRARDWMVSRKRDWGTPLPAVNCVRCGLSPVAEANLPVRLPAHGGDGTATCAHCKTRQPTVTRNLDCFLDDAWCFWAAHPDWKPDTNPFRLWATSPPASVFFHSGYDSFIYLYLYRFLGHALRDIGLMAAPEIVDGFMGHDVVTSEGRKMSKRHGNAPDLDDLIRIEGAGVVRLAVLSGANPSSRLPWSEDCLQRARRMMTTSRRLREVHAEAGQAPDRRIRHHLEKAERYMDEYRIGSAVQEVYLATKYFLRTGSGGEGSRDSVISWWDIFTPGVTRRTTATQVRRVLTAASG